MPAPPLIVVHERIGRWHRRLRPVFVGVEPEPRWVESRGTRDLDAATRGAVCPIVLIDLGHRVREGLDAVDLVATAAPDALVLVLDPAGHAGIEGEARGLGAAEVMVGAIRPPEVVSLVRRWLDVARRRDAGSGWFRPVPTEPEAWEDPDAFARKWLSAARWSGR